MSQLLVAMDQVVAPNPVSTEPSALELEDMLYDIVASGADPSLPEGTVEAVQTFLHEHARSKHTLEEFLAFFKKHGLSTVKETTLTLALPPMDLRALSVSAPVAPPAAAIVQPEPEPIEVAPVTPPKPSYSRAIAWACGVAALAAVSCGAYVGFASLSSELEAERAAHRATADRVARLEAETVNLRQGLEQNTAKVQRADQKSELLLQTFGSPLDPERR